MNFQFPKKNHFFDFSFCFSKFSFFFFNFSMRNVPPLSEKNHFFFNFSKKNVPPLFEKTQFFTHIFEAKIVSPPPHISCTPSQKNVVPPPQIRPYSCTPPLSKKGLFLGVSSILKKLLINDYPLLEPKAGRQELLVIIASEQMMYSR